MTGRHLLLAALAPTTRFVMLRVPSTGTCIGRGWIGRFYGTITVAIIMLVVAGWLLHFVRCCAAGGHQSRKKYFKGMWSKWTSYHLWLWNVWTFMSSASHLQFSSWLNGCKKSRMEQTNQTSGLRTMTIPMTTQFWLNSSRWSRTDISTTSLAIGCQGEQVGRNGLAEFDKRVV